jgi:hypothetical protein
MQLDLFMPEEKHYPFQRQPKAKEIKIITEIFGEDMIGPISLFLNDILQLYPYKQYCKDTCGGPGRYLTIGASCNYSNDFYMMGREDRNIYLIHQFNTLPDIEEWEAQGYKTKSGEIKK